MISQLEFRLIGIEHALLSQVLSGERAGSDSMLEISLSPRFNPFLSRNTWLCMPVSVLAGSSKRSRQLYLDNTNDFFNLGWVKGKSCNAASQTGRAAGHVRLKECQYVNLRKTGKEICLRKCPSRDRA